MTQNFEIQGCQRHRVKRIKSILQIMGIVEQGLRYLFIASSSFYFLKKKTDLEWHFSKGSHIINTVTKDKAFITVMSLRITTLSPTELQGSHTTFKTKFQGLSFTFSMTFP